MHPTARVIEIFSSIQGEGIHLGQLHLFVRFWNCNLACHYCDTDYRGPYTEHTQAELTARVQELIQREGPFHAVSLTGGEPLLWSKFLREWLPALKQLGQQVYLETNGTLPSALSEILPWVDIVAMDIKPPSATGDRPMWEAHREFLAIAHAAQREVFIKVVVTPETLDQEIRQACELTAAVSRNIPLVLQPVTPWGSVAAAPTDQQLARWSDLAKNYLADVRVIPQVHHLIGVP